MLPPETRLEIVSKLPKRATRKPPLLFVHGGYCDAWCWTPYFLPWFAAHGWPSYALSLRGHGGSGGLSSLFVAGLDDFVADVEHVAGQLDAPPMLIGHSMGAAVIERMLATRPMRAAALLAPVPPAGLISVATRLAAAHPDYISQLAQFDPSKLSDSLLATLRPFYFSAGVPAAILKEAERHLSVESPRALLDLSLRLHMALPERPTSPVLVLGAQNDRICTPGDARATAHHHGVVATILPGMAHMLMLESEWEIAAEALAGWLAEVN
jgi:pimeloyl-ACP methyl ester carboxylesterase